MEMINTPQIFLQGEYPEYLNIVRLILVSFKCCKLVIVQKIYKPRTYV